MVGLGQFNVQAGGEGEDKLFAGGQMNLQLGGDGDDWLVGLGATNVQHGGKGDDKLIAVGNLNVQMGADGDDWVIGGGQGNIQFGDHLLSAIPAGFDMPEAIADVIALGADQLVGSDTGTNVMLAGGKGNLQIGGAGTDIAFGAGTGGGNVRLGGDGGDVLIGGGKGNAQFGGAGDDLLAGYGQLNVQHGGAGEDVLFGIARGAGMAAQLQMGDAGTDLMIGFASDTKKDVAPEAEAGTVGQEVEDFALMLEIAGKPKESSHLTQVAAATDELVLRIGQMRDAVKNFDPSVNVQLGGDDADMAIAGGAFGVQLGQEGNDVFLGGGKYNLQFGGEGEDLFLASNATLNFHFGGAGDDWIVDKMVFAGFMAASLAPDAVETVANIVDGVAQPLMAAAGAVKSAGDAIASLNPLAEADVPAPDYDLNLDAFLDFSATQYIGGAGNDVLGAGGSGGDLVGGQGDDTYLYTFGYGGAHVVDEEGLNAARNWADLLGLEDDLLDDITGGAGGDDVIELRGWGTLMEIGVENVGFSIAHGSDLVLSMQTEGGIALDGAGSITLRGMDLIDTRVETLRIVNRDGFTDYDLGAAWDAGDFDMFQWKTDEGETSPTAAIFEDLAPEWLETAATGFGNIPFATEAADRAVAAVDPLLDMITPDMPDIHALV